VGLLLRGEIEVSPGSRLLAASALTGAEAPITIGELRTLLDVPDSAWTELEVDEDVESLLRRGLLVADAGEPALAELRERDERLTAAQWHPYSAVFHALTRWRDVEVAAYPNAAELPPGAAEASQDAFVEQFGPPPPHFHELRPPHERTKLRLPAEDGALHRLLERRRTTRAFDRAAKVTREQLSAILYHVFGCRATTQLAGDHLALRKTSPSAGALHPIEAYVLAVRVEGLDAGVYHYGTRDHSLEPLEALPADDAEALGARFMCGQDYLAAAGALFLLTARFYRSFWKYRRNERAYATLLLDAGHLSQTLYFVAADLGLGAFVTAAINGANIEERLGLDPAEEGAIAICGCGVPAREPSELEPEFEPHAPPRP
jgi:putative peptide maturation dehydrogenase